MGLIIILLTILVLVIVIMIEKIKLIRKKLLHDQDSEGVLESLDDF